jgi:hypothetical protein
MSMGKTLLAGLLGGIIMFVWGAAVHMGIPASVWGRKALPAPEVILPVLEANITEPGWYDFAGGDPAAPLPPSGVLLYHPDQARKMSPKTLAIEFLSNIAGAMILAVILAGAGASALRGAVFGCLAGVFAWVSIDVSYWNWDGHPDSATFCGLLEQAGGWLLAGAAIGPIVRRRSQVAA